MDVPDPGTARRQRGVVDVGECPVEADIYGFGSINKHLSGAEVVPDSRLLRQVGGCSEEEAELR